MSHFLERSGRDLFSLQGDYYICKEKEGHRDKVHIQERQLRIFLEKLLLF